MLRVAIASLLAYRLRLILTAVTIALGVALVTGTLVLTDSVRGVLDGTVTTSPAGLVIVQPSSQGDRKLSSGPDSLAATLVARIGGVRGVAAAQGLVTAMKIMLLGKDGRPIRHARAVNELLTYPADPGLAAVYTIQSGHPPVRAGQALLDAATARALSYRPGDRIGVVTAAGVRTVTIAGITGFGGADSPPAEQVASFDSPTVLVVPPVTAQQLAGLSGRYTEIAIRMATGTSAAALCRRIATLLPPGFVAVTSRLAAAQDAAPSAGHLDWLRRYLLALSAVALLVGAFIIADTFVLLGARRTREFALLRVIGATRRQVLGAAMAEAALLGLAGSAAGAGLGSLAAIALRGILRLLGGSLPAAGLVFTPRIAATALATGTAVTVASALRPARRAARVAPVRALREAQPGRTGLRAIRSSCAAAAMAAGLALLVTGSVLHSGPSVVLAGAGAVAVVGSMVAAAPLLAGPVARLAVGPWALRRRLGRTGGTAVRLAGESSAASPGRTAATAAILIIGLAAAAAVSVITGSARASAAAAVGASSRADLYLQGGIDARLAAEVAARPGVSAVLRFDDPLVAVAGAAARVDGIDPGSATHLVDFGVRTGSLTALRGNELFVSVPQALRHGWRAGSRIVLDFGSGRPVAMIVAGTFADKQFFGDDYLLPIATLFRDMPDQLGQAGLLLIRAAPGTSARALQASITVLLLPDPQDTLQTTAQYQRSRAADLGDLSHALALLTLLFGLTTVIAALGIANALALSVAERTGEFALLRAIGLTRGQLNAMIGAESVIMCLAGALPGIAAGLAAGAALAAALTRSQTGVATVALSPAQLVVALAASCLAAVLAGILPGWRAGRVRVQQASLE